MEGIALKVIGPSNKGDVRGPVCNWQPPFSPAHIATHHRVAGSIADNHYHRGADPSKNPDTYPAETYDEFVKTNKKKYRAGTKF